MSSVRYELNNTTFTLCTETGALLSLEYPGTKPMLKNEALETGERPTYGGLLDIAWPVHYEYETLRANPTGKAKACPPRIDYDGKKLTITYDMLPQTYDDPDITEQVKGGIYARIELNALADGKSVSMQCFVRNNSVTDIRQILFPNFDGLSRTEECDIPGGSTEFTMMGGRINPYTYDRTIPASGTWSYPQNIRDIGLTLGASGIQTGPYMGRWYDWGSYEGGFSIYHKHWGWDRDFPEKMGEGDPIWLHYDQKKNRVRAAGMCTKTIACGESWDSGEYIMTAHTGSWLFGADSYKKWLHSNVKRVLPMPKRAREMMGFRTINMASYPNDPEDVTWYYTDLPAIAEDMVEHGILDLNVWKGFNYTLPLTEDCFYKRWGGLSAWKENVAKCRDIGITVTAFVSWLSLWSETCDNYGIQERSGTWAGSDQMIPSHRAPYADKFACWQLWDHKHPRWAQDVRDALRFIRDKADCPDISWDQYILGDGSDETFHDIVNEYRLETEKMYPGSVWSSESTLFFESELDNADFTWNGTVPHSRFEFDFRPLMSIVNLMRPDISLENNVQDVKITFMDNLMMNINPEDAKYFRDVPSQAAMLKTLATLREKYMDYMAYGDNLGDGILTAPAVNCRVTAYQKSDKSMVLFALKDSDDTAAVSLNLAPFMDERMHSIRILNENGDIWKETEIQARDTIDFAGAKDELVVIEIF